MPAPRALFSHNVQVEKMMYFILSFGKKQMYNAQSPSPTTLIHVTLCFACSVNFSGALRVHSYVHSCLQDRVQTLYVTLVGIMVSPIDFIFQCRELQASNVER